MPALARWTPVVATFFTSRVTRTLRGGECKLRIELGAVPDLAGRLHAPAGLTPAEHLLALHGPIFGSA